MGNCGLVNCSLELMECEGGRMFFKKCLHLYSMLLNVILLPIMRWINLLHEFSLRRHYNVDKEVNPYLSCTCRKQQGIKTLPTREDARDLHDILASARIEFCMKHGSLFSELVQSS